MTKVFFITATGTEIGKTFLVSKAIKHLKNLRKSVAAIKPIISGIDESNYPDSDSAIILNALGTEVNKENLSYISPWQYKIPAAPNIAASSAGEAQIDFPELVKFCHKFIKDNQDKDFIFIEGVGGLMVPLNDTHLIADLVKELDCELIICSGNYLGTISHTLTTLFAAKAYCKGDIKLFLNNYPAQNIDVYNDNLQSIKSFANMQVFSDVGDKGFII